MFPHHGDEGANEGRRPYRMTSTLTLHSAQARGEEPDPTRDFYRDPFDRGKLIASDGADNPRRKAKAKSSRDAVKDRFDELLEPYLLHYYYIKETILYPIRQAIERVDVVIEGMQQAGSMWQQLVAHGVQELFRPRKPRPEPAAGEMEGLPVKPVSFCDLYQFNVQFTDNLDQALYDFERSKRSKYAPSPLVVDPMATEKAIQAIRECADRAQGIPPATEGRYAGIPLAHVLYHITPEDLQGFLRYVKAYPGNYVGRNLKISETFATWVVYGAPDP